MNQRLLLCAAAILALLVTRIALPHDTRAEAIAVEHNYVFLLNCSPAPADTIATFAIPGASDVESQIGAVPDQVWIDLTLFDNNFAPGTFIGAGRSG